MIHVHYLQNNIRYLLNKQGKEVEISETINKKLLTKHSITKYRRIKMFEI